MKKFIFILTLAITVVVIFKTFGQQQQPPQKQQYKPTNLKVLPKDISNDSLHALMKFYSKSLGVKCEFCHARQKDDPKHLDFAADTKDEKLTARKMMDMTADINKKYIGKMDGHLESINCVTCHMGRSTPIISVDSLSTK